MQNVKVDRDKYIGGSDIPIIMGISSFKKRWELLQEKAGLVEDTFEGNIYTEYGNILEPKIRDFINQDLKDKFVEGKDIIGDIRCHTDGINKTTILEIKTTSQIYSTLEEYKVYLVQLLFYMKYTKRKKGKLAVYERPENFNKDFDESRLTIYDIDIKDYKPLLDEIDLAVDDFRNDLRRLKENPFITETDLEPKELIEKDPEKVRKFVNSSIKGWHEAINNPEKAIDELIKVNSSLNYEHQLGYLNKSIPIILTDEKIGISDEAVWQDMIDNLYDFGVIKNKLKANEIFTNEFID